MAFCLSCFNNRELVVFTGNTMGTTYSIKVIGNFKKIKITPKDMKKKIKNTLKEVNNQMSTWQKDSEITIFNKSMSTDWQRISYDFAYVVNKAIETSELSNGYFDITVAPLVNAWGFGPDSEISAPTVEKLKEIRQYMGYEKLAVKLSPPSIKKEVPEVTIDLSAIAKGFGVDKVGQLIEKLGFRNYMVEIGGEVRVNGKNIKNNFWKVGIASPVDNGTLTNIIKLENKSVATSGDYRNYREVNGKRISHTINPKTEFPVSHNLASVTVIADTCCEADALATAFNTMGMDSAMAIAEEKLIPVFFIYHENNEFKTLSNHQFDKLMISD